MFKSGWYSFFTNRFSVFGYYGIVIQLLPFSGISLLK